jgi:hypothetical protein
MTNYFKIPASLEVTELACKSGNTYLVVNGIVSNVASQDCLDILALGGRQVGGPAVGARLSWVAGRFYTGLSGLTPATLLTVASTIYAYPLYIPGNAPLQSLNIDVTTGQTGGKVRAALYNDLNGAPSSLVAGSDTGDLAGTGTAVVGSSAIALSIPEGWYWAAVQAMASSTMPTVESTTANAALELSRDLGFDTAAHAFATSAQFLGGVSAASTYGAMPANFPTASYALGLGATAPLVVLGT